MTYLIVGGSGFIGTSIANFLIGQNKTVVVIDRVASSVAGVRSIVCDAVSSIPAPDFDLGQTVIINLAGKNIFGRFTKQHKQGLYDSRVNLTKTLYQWCVQHKLAVVSYIGASAVGYYGDRPGELLDEQSQPGNTFLAQLCIDWEQQHRAFGAMTNNVVILRQGHVLGRGGLLGVLVPLFKWGIGGPLGNGSQYMPWIGIDDLVQIYIMATTGMIAAGTYNAVSNQSVTNLQFSKSLAVRLHKPCWLPVPRFALWLRFGSFADEMLVDQNISGRAIAAYVDTTPLDKVLSTVI